MSKTENTSVPKQLVGKVTDELRRRRLDRAAATARRAGAVATTPGLTGSDDRLVPSPVFLLSSMRSGSTLLRSLLDTHPEITAPHEMHLGELALRKRTDGVAKSQLALGLDENDLLILLWDRVLYRQLQLSGKSVIVDKTPKNTFEWKRIQAGWPSARFILLLRHPEQIFRSLESSRGDQGNEHHFRTVNRYARTLDAARKRLDCVVVRYEDLTADAAGETQRICAYLGIGWDERMLDYGSSGITYVRGLGDWSENIRSGKVQAAAPLPAPEDVPDELRDACALLGY